MRAVASRKPRASRRTSRIKPSPSADADGAHVVRRLDCAPPAGRPHVAANDRDREGVVAALGDVQHLEVGDVLHEVHRPASRRVVEAEVEGVVPGQEDELEVERDADEPRLELVRRPVAVGRERRRHAHAVDGRDADLEDGVRDRARHVRGEHDGDGLAEEGVLERPPFAVVERHADEPRLAGSDPSRLVGDVARLARLTASARYSVTTASTRPSAAMRPSLSRIARSQSVRIADMLWLTKRTVLPWPETSRIFPRLFAWNSASPTDRTSSTTRMSGSRCAATANASRMYMPLEYRFTGVSMNFSTPAQSTIWSNLAEISDPRMPRMAPFRYTLSRPVRSWWKPVPISSSEASLPHTSA